MFNHSPEFLSSYKTEALYQSKSPLLFSPQLLAAAMGLSVSMNLANLDISGNQTILVFL